LPEPATLGLFEGFGIEIEYMIAGTEDLSVRPIADEVLRDVAGEYAMEVELGDIAWSNELALHVIELKTNGPAASLSGVDDRFQHNVNRINALLEPRGACLLPTAMHPWMDPERELRLWPHENDVIYETFDRIFGCKGHGWANLQSVHVNLPFRGDREFGRLHAAIRLVLPIIPGIAASSPFIDGVPSGLADTRLEIYRNNAVRIPLVAGRVIPERVFSRREYEEDLLGAIYTAMADHDPDGILRHEWVNSRGCIARFDRSAIEIRLVDTQECPRADIAVAGAITAVVRALTEEAWCSTRTQQGWDERELAAILLAAIRDADESVVANRRFLDLFGFPERGRARLRDLWQHLVETTVAKEPGFARWREPLELIARRGCLARRLLVAAGPEPGREDLHALYRRLAGCLARGELFEP
jgi:carboxylate-amine ligase